MTTRAELEAEAAELYKYAAVRGNTLVPKQSAIDLAQQARVRAKTITAEQVEAAAKAVCRAHQDMDGDYPWDVQFEDGKEEYRDWARAALTAAGFYVEGDDHE